MRQMSPLQSRMSSRRLPGAEVSCGLPAAHGPGNGRVAESYVRVTGRVLRGPVGVAVAVASFTAAGTVGGRTGLAVASGYVAVIGVYCMLNFLRCRETHCVVTGPGWILTAALGLTAALVPGSALAWYRPGTEAAVYLVILAAGYALEGAVAARTGRRALR